MNPYATESPPWGVPATGPAGLHSSENHSGLADRGSGAPVDASALGPREGRSVNGAGPQENRTGPSVVAGPSRSSGRSHGRSARSWWRS